MEGREVRRRKVGGRKRKVRGRKRKERNEQKTERKVTCSFSFYYNTAFVVSFKIIIHNFSNFMKNWKNWMKYFR